MDPRTALAILEPLADGVDPVTGEVLSDDSPYQRAPIVRALFAAIQALERAQKHRQRMKALPARAGDSWTTEEEDRLTQAFDAGNSVEQLAQMHQRTRGAIESRLIRLGKLKPAHTNGPEP